MVAFKRFEAAVISRALYLYYHRKWRLKAIEKELNGPSFWAIRQWVRQFRGRSEAILKVMERFGESIGKVFADRAVEVFSALRRFAGRCGLEEDSETVQAVQPVLLGHRVQVPLFRSG